jgi:osmotically-inducible protein OsmY
LNVLSGLRQTGDTLDQTAPPSFLTQVKKATGKSWQDCPWQGGSTIEATAMSDKQVKQEILDVFQWDPRVETAHIGVSVEHGVVTLTGDVGTEDERIAAEEALRHVAGVRQILQRIEVRYPAAASTRHGELEFEIATD